MSDQIYKDLRALIERKNKYIEKLEAQLKECQNSNVALRERLFHSSPLNAS